jgi:Flp pilus assembly protein TadG
MRSGRQKRGGNITVLVALCLVALVAVAAISLDGGVLQEDRRKAQATADAAALAAATNLYENYELSQGLDPQGTAKAAALAVASANGFANDGTTSTVTVNIPPTSGIMANKAGYAEVVVRLNQSRYFSRVGGSDPLPVTARSVARGRWSAFNNGILVLDPHLSGSLNAGGGGSVSVVGANIIVDSDSPTAAIANGGGTLSAPEFDITGVPGTSTPGGGSFSGTVLSGQTPTPDPLAYLPVPDTSTMTVQSNKAINDSSKKPLTLNPGVYKGGISVSGQGLLTLNPGIYYMDGGGFSFTGQGGMTANRVMIYVNPASNSDNITINGSGPISLTPPTSSIYQGISLFQARSSTNTVAISGNGNTAMYGTFYVAGGTLKVTGNGAGDVLGSQYISYDLVTGGNGSFKIVWKVDQVARVRQIGLVE